MAIMDSAAVQHRKQYIGGEWVEAASGESFDDLNPYTGDVMATVAAGSRADAAAAVKAAAEAFPAWAATPPAEKQRLLLKTADIPVTEIAAVSASPGPPLPGCQQPGFLISAAYRPFPGLSVRKFPFLEVTSS